MNKLKPPILGACVLLAGVLATAPWPGNATWGGHGYYGGHYSPSYRYGYTHRYSRYGYGYRRHSSYYPLGRSLAYTAPRSYDSSYEGNSDIDRNTGIGAAPPADGWALLQDGDTRQALQAFAAAAARAPDEARPKAGYALATALSGDYDRGVWAMRRALRVDPDALHYLRLEPRATERITGLLPHYGSDYTSDGGPFMRGALLYLLGRDADARIAVAASLDSGDDAVSTRNLQDLIGAKGASPSGS